MNGKSKVYLSLGSNVGDRLLNLRQALQRLNDTSGIWINAVSPVYEAEAHTRPGDAAMPDFLNLVVAIETDRSPRDLLEACLSIESAGGRTRSSETWLPRTIDIDILVFANQVLDSERLKVPHPRMAERRFVLQPFADLAPDTWVPEPFSTTVSAMLERSADRLRIERRYPAKTVFPGERAVHEPG